ncbi:hypothetical protein BT93_H0336 [Corymbia citriodora subsp. variegata]|nr:hypothetical protein BT93_H0336 [Corymbia citriodora subsp. variegata]
MLDYVIIKEGILSNVARIFPILNLEAERTSRIESAEPIRRPRLNRSPSRKAHPFALLSLSPPVLKAKRLCCATSVTRGGFEEIATGEEESSHFEIRPRTASVSSGS